jgi:hypothetical protein
VKHDVRVEFSNRRRRCVYLRLANLPFAAKYCIAGQPMPPAPIKRTWLESNFA